jgi:diguanylate cyclase (GGDEF)-like protein
MTTTLDSSPACGEAAALVQALSESRERWRALVLLGADLGFETDGAGRFTVLVPDTVLGWPAERLIGTPAQALLTGEDPASYADQVSSGGLFNPFRTPVALRRRRVWLREASGASACLLLSAAPVPGRPGAVRGLGIDITGQERHDATLAATLRRREMARTIARRMRDVALPFASLTVALNELIHAFGAPDRGGQAGSGAAIGASLILHDREAPLRVAAKVGQPWPGPLQALHDAVLASCEQPPAWLRERTQRSVVCGQSLLLCTTTNHFIDRSVLAIWRQGGWSEEEAALAAALLPTMQPVLEHEQIQRETARLSRTDILTGLFNRQGFIAELSRRLERLDREGLHATLMVVGLDGLGPVNTSGGVDTGDTALRDAAAILRNLVRPTDLVGRLGGDLFGLWLDGADQFTAAERAESLRLGGIPVGGPIGVRMTVSIGLAVRSSRSFESIESLLHRAWAAMRVIKLGSGDRWQVSAEEPTP